MIRNKTHSNLLQFELLNQLNSSFFHFTTTVSGGVSSGNYATFNMGLHSGDSFENVSENRRRLSEILSIDKENLIIPQQVHKDDILIIDKAFLSKSKSEQDILLSGIDAIIADQKRICIGVTTADCVPILIYDPILKVFAAIHAGWRGTVTKLVEKTIFEMNNKFSCKSGNLIACIGPAISQEFFEVGSDVTEAFIEAGFLMDSIEYINTNTGKTHIDLCLATKFLLTKNSIPSKNIETANLCTYSNPDLFFSARRQGIQSGRILTGGILY